jgi:hypothetical protein
MLQIDTTGHSRTIRELFFVTQTCCTALFRLVQLDVDPAGQKENAMPTSLQAGNALWEIETEYKTVEKFTDRGSGWLTVLSAWLASPRWQPCCLSSKVLAPGFLPPGHHTASL